MVIKTLVIVIVYSYWLWCERALIYSELTYPVSSVIKLSFYSSQ